MEKGVILSDEMEFRSIRYFGTQDHFRKAPKQKLAQMRPLSNSALQHIRENLFLEWTYNSNSIEGNTLNLQETRIVLQDGMTVKGKSLREH